MSCASFSSARPAIRRACSSEVRVLLVLRSSAQSVARVLGVSNGHGLADAIARLSRMTTDQKGAIAELAIQLAATKLGIDVYLPVAEGGRYDMILDLDSGLVRVQCKWASRYGDVVMARCCRCRRNRDGLVRRLYKRGEIDAFALYCLELDRSFFVPIAHAEGLQEIRLRLSPARNNQKRGFTGLTTSTSQLHFGRTKGP
jgi:PD-(D/E)XK endonuclease